MMRCFSQLVESGSEDVLKEVRDDAEFCLAPFVFVVFLQHLGKYLGSHASTSLGDRLQ